MTDQRREEEEENRMVRIIFKFKLPKTEYVLSDFTSMITGEKISGSRQSIAIRYPNISISHHFSDLSRISTPISVYSSFFRDVISLSVRVLAIDHRLHGITSVTFLRYSNIYFIAREIPSYV